MEKFKALIGNEFTAATRKAGQTELHRDQGRQGRAGRDPVRAGAAGRLICCFLSWQSLPQLLPFSARSCLCLQGGAGNASGAGGGC